MNRSNIRRFAALTGLSATALYAAQPPDPSAVQSDGFYNVAVGPLALSHDTTPPKPCVPFVFNSASNYMSGCANTASGFAALDLNTTGTGNTATGAGALYANTGGAYNTAVGMLAMFHTTMGNSNAALGDYALFSNTTGNANVASGTYALFSNTSGSFNTASGNATLQSNTTGAYNTAVGVQALFANATGSYNTASGRNSLLNNTTGHSNTASGDSALVGNTSGAYNTGSGAGALQASTTGVGNTALGFTAGKGLVTGSYNTYIGFGVAGITGTDNYVTQIGVSTLDPNVSGTPTTYISGIYNTPLSGNAVVVTSTGQLGVAAVSSGRFKTDVAAMGSSTAKLDQLRPVTFRLKGDSKGTQQYGLIAEEVAAVYPELVIRDQSGQIDGVRYDELAPMLLNELQNQQRINAAQAARNDAQAAKIASLEQQLAGIQAALMMLQPNAPRVAQR